MAALVAIYNGDHLARDWRRRDTRPPKTGLTDTRHELRSRLSALAGLWEELCRTEGVYTSSSDVVETGGLCEKSHARKELFRPTQAPQIGAAPPPYDDCVADLPLDYSLTETLATVQLHKSGLEGPEKDATLAFAIPRSTPDDIDWTSPAGLRVHAKKKAKQAAKSAQKDKWAGSDDEGEKPPGEDGEGGAGDGAGGEGGSGAGGDGGDPPGDGGNGGDGGDGGDDWTGATAGKKGKKKKKNAWEEYEAEEAARKAEEEAAANGDVAAVVVPEPEAVDDWQVSQRLRMITDPY